MTMTFADNIQTLLTIAKAYKYGEVCNFTLKRIHKKEKGKHYNLRQFSIKFQSLATKSTLSAQAFTAVNNQKF